MSLLQLVDYPVDQIVDYGTSLELSCTIRSNHRDAQIDWFRHNRRLEPSNRVKIEIIRKRRIITRLSILDFGLDDPGIYQCRNRILKMIISTPLKALLFLDYMANSHLCLPFFKTAMNNIRF